MLYKAFYSYIYHFKVAIKTKGLYTSEYSIIGMYINDELYREIIKKHEILKQRDQAEKDLYSLFADRNHKDSLQHSIRLSKPTATLLKDLPSKDRKKAMDEYNRTLNNLQKAWDYGLNNYHFPFDEEFLFQIAYLVEPENYKGEKAHYRTMTMGVRPTGAKVTPPYPAKIPLEMEKLFINGHHLDNHVKKQEHKEDNTIDISSYLHLELTRIHPFEDGNGRVARLMGNLVLIKNEYPPLIIPEGERVTYNQILRNYGVGFNDRGKKLVYDRNHLSEEEKMAYDYFAGKINSSLDRLLEGKH